MTVRAGEEQSGVSLTIRAVNVSTLAGTVVDAGGQPATTTSVLLYWKRRPDSAAGDVLITSGAVTLPRAIVQLPAFTIAGLWPGEYTIIASSRSGQRGAAPPNPQTPAALWSVTDITVDGSDRSGLQLRLLPGLRLSGTYRFAGATTAPEAGTVEVMLKSVEAPAGTLGESRATLDPAGTLTFTSIPPGRYLIQATTSARWMLESAMLDGRDLADRPFEVTTSGESRAGLTVTFTDRPARIDGQLVDDTGAPVTRYGIVVFPVDATLWHPLARRTRLVRPATDGTFSVANLPAGEYALAAADDVTTVDLDPGLLQELLAASIRVTLGPGAQVRQVLKAVR